MARTAQILSKVRRNLSKYSERDIQDRVIYQQMQEAQTQIILLTQCLEKELEITTIANQESYDLEVEIENGGLFASDGAELYDSDGNRLYATPDETETENIVGEIKSLIPPETYGPIDIVPEDEYNGMKPYLTLVANPSICTVFDNQIHFYPAPVSSNDIIKAWYYLNDSITKIAKAVEPEIQIYWNKAIEYFATSEFLTGDEQVHYLNLFQDQISKYESKPHAKHQKAIVPDADW